MGTSMEWGQTGADICPEARKQGRDKGCSLYLCPRLAGGQGSAIYNTIMTVAQSEYGTVKGVMIQRKSHNPLPNPLNEILRWRFIIAVTEMKRSGLNALKGIAKDTHESSSASFTPVMKSMSCTFFMGSLLKYLAPKYRIGNKMSGK